MNKLQGELYHLQIKVTVFQLAWVIWRPQISKVIYNLPAAIVPFAIFAF